MTAGQDLDQWELQQGSIYYAQDKASSPAPKKPALRTFETVLDTNRDLARSTKIQDGTTKVLLSSNKELKSTDLIQSPPKDYTYLLVQNSLTEGGGSSIQDELLNQAARITTLEEELDKMKEKLNPIYGLHCLLTREIIPFTHHTEASG
ncbi:hypothetical protein GOP47_0009572 [Adiantum capillus-veneris]|uniref:Uncharacterized protein n=1 Tax=Adiantum capillus-veneris TaxID=13818 RepID=A0A9D4UWW6_ADICA|nr:hypothetical protein GOP47_0009572 [Adiantum capillus-veneris]